MVVPGAFWMLWGASSRLLHAYLAVLGLLLVIGGVWMFAGKSWWCLNGCWCVYPTSWMRCPLNYQNWFVQQLQHTHRVRTRYSLQE